MEISLIRHGKSQLNENDKITCLEFKKWVEKYDCNGVCVESTYPSDTVSKVKSAKKIITSDMNRAVHSAKLLSPEAILISESLFREAELPTAFKKFGVKLRPTNWAIILRLLWFLGYSNECESLSNAKLRAKKASQKLIEYAEEHQKVALVGHGFFNMLVAKELRKKGLKGKKRTGSKHWSCTTYSL
ncbi:histidine phosphatase family protein [Evansella cellulosilytica]|uniref:Phosphoglycerate mutase n=1 Tax=Evansella cellulosilytica (strain ATCC 21833 / DSM 2522 / FERM P-1141 / JCM 9156 / N-4) TaxID=649639 RepID=E6TSL9_EVAC2|nr:histidine phosphatase family protein [Evansella cellulosilytica]ADU29527.1 Phosphoglycerate mutase [Evansella cellulosilytica DSM 2522]